MTNDFHPVAALHRRGRSPWLAVLAGIALFVFAMNASAQAPAAAAPVAPASDTGQFDTLVGPIALYPDDLIAIILPASTSPLQIVQADRYLDKRKADPKLPLDDKWDDPVKSLLNYPDVVKMMSADLDWTSALGEAVVADQAAVLEAVQSFRRRAQAAGNLKTDAKQVVTAEKEIIIIQPADPQVIYVPQYNPSTVVVYGAAPVYGYYPTPYPSYYYPYPPGAAMAAGVIWGAAIGAAWSGNHYGYGGGNNTININRNTNINTSNISSTNVNRSSAAGSGSAWQSNKQPGQVSGSVGKSSPSARVGDTRAGAGAAGSAAGGARASTQPGGGIGAAAGGARPSTQPSGAGASGGSAFANSNASGRQTQANSSRGASSRSSASSMGGRPSGGGARSGGGGGGRGGGGRR